MSSRISKLPVGWLCACALIAGASAGWSLGRAPLQVALAKQGKTHATEKQQAAESAAKVLKAAQDRGDTLSTELLEKKTQIDQLKKEASYAIVQVTTGKPCLNTATLRVLDSAPGLRVAGLPPATGGAAAADGPIATDTDIAGWAVDAGAAYEVCRARFDALIDWHTAPLGLESR